MMKVAYTYDALRKLTSSLDYFVNMTTYMLIILLIRISD